MDALSNAPKAAKGSRSGTAPISLPKAKHSKSGVSVEYAYDPAKVWLVFRVSYNRTDKAADLLIEAGHYVYVAKRIEWSEIDGHRRKVLTNLIPNILFVYIQSNVARNLLSKRAEDPSAIPALASIASFYYNHFAHEGNRNPPLEIPERQMLSFIEITKTEDNHLIYTSDDRIVHVKSNDYVRVTEGKFEGCMGLVVRVAGQQRVAIRLADLGWVATSYIPSAFLEVVTKEDYDRHLDALSHPSPCDQHAEHDTSD